MKYIFLFYTLLSCNAFACIIGPAQLDVSEANGFSFSESDSVYYDSVNEIKITAPLKYKGETFELGIYSISLNGKLVGKSIHSSINESGVPEFLGYVSNKPGFSYSISFLYGEGRCKSYEFTASSNGK
jgi:hypothetical protein